MQNAIGILMHWTKQSHTERERCVMKFHERCLLAGRAGMLAVPWLCRRREETVLLSVQFSSVAQSCPTLRPHGLQQARPPCPSWTPRACSNSCPLSQWCHPTISSSVISFSFCLNLSQGLFQWVNSLHQVAKVLEFMFQYQSFQEYSGLISFRMDWLYLLAVQGTLRVFSNTTVQKHQFFCTQLSL